MFAEKKSVYMSVLKLKKYLVDIQDERINDNKVMELSPKEELLIAIMKN